MVNGDVKIVSPLLLAAGRSQRFGTDKLIHPTTIDGQTQPLIVHTLQTWLKVFEELNVVIHKENNQLLEILKSESFSSQLNLIPVADKERSMSASLISGVSATDTASAWLIGLADMPFIPSYVLKASLNALDNGAKITLPIFEQKRGHPVGFHSDFLMQLQALTGDQGAKKIIQANPQSITYINSPSNGIWLDIDTPEDLVTINNN